MRMAIYRLVLVATIGALAFNLAVDRHWLAIVMSCVAIISWFVVIREQGKIDRED